MILLLFLFLFRHSLLNLPMLMLLHIFIAVAGESFDRVCIYMYIVCMFLVVFTCIGVWGIMQNKEFLKQDPRVILVRRTRDSATTAYV